MALIQLNVESIQMTQSNGFEYYYLKNRFNFNS